MADNPDLRSLAKLMLNSFCCKFEQRENQSKRITIKKPAVFFSMMSNLSLNVNRVLAANEDTLIKLLIGSTGKKLPNPYPQSTW